MSDSIKAGDFRICPSCGSRNKAAHNTACAAALALDAAAAAPGSRPRRRRGPEARGRCGSCSPPG